jgi:F-type H+-transporting ATPase subunit b
LNVVFNTLNNFIFAAKDAASEPNWAGRLFDLDGQTAISIGLQLMNVSVLAVLLTVILYSPVREFMAKRSAKIANQLREADENKTAALELRDEYEKRLANIEAEKSEILAAVRADANANANRIIDEASKEAATVRERAKNDAQAEMDSVKEEVRLHIIEVSTVLASKFVQNAIDAATQERLFNEALSELGRATWPNQ